MDRLIKDSSVLSNLDKDEDIKIVLKRNLNIRGAFYTMLKIYKGEYPKNKFLIKCINAASYLDCKDKLDQLLILLSFSGFKDDISKLDDNLQYHFNILKKKSTRDETFIINDMLEILIHFKYDFAVEDFILACINGALKTAQHIYNISKNASGKLSFKTRSIQYSICPKTISEHINKTQYLNIVQWLYSIEDELYDIDQGFLHACINGNLDIIEWLLPMINHGILDIAFSNASTSGRFEVVRRLYQIDNPHYSYEHYFSCACINGSLEIAQWLYERKSNCINIDNSLFIETCRNNHLSIVKWLYSLGADPNVVNYRALKNACLYDHVEMLEWLFFLPVILEINDNDNDNDLERESCIIRTHSVFCFICARCKISIIKTFYDISQRSPWKIIIDDDTLECVLEDIMESGNDRSEIIEWLNNLNVD